jgi:predicted transcriptional regulator
MKKGIKGPRHRPPDEIKLAILNYLYEHGPTGITELEYGVEINNALFKREGKYLLANKMVTAASKKEIEPSLIPKKRARLNDNVTRLLFITPEGEKCMHLMKERAALLKISKPYLPPKRCNSRGWEK